MEDRDRRATRAAPATPASAPAFASETRFAVALALAGALHLACSRAGESVAAEPAPRAPAIDRAVQKLDPELAGAHRAIQAGRYPEARTLVEDYRLRAGANARAGQAAFLIGLSYHEPELYLQAEPHFESAIELEPEYLATYYYHGFCLFHLGRVADARAAFERYLAGDPGKAEALFGLALVALEEDRVDEAEALIARAIGATEAKMQQLRPGDKGDQADDARADLSRYHARLADVYLRRDELARAREMLEKSVALWPDHYEAWHKLHRVRTRLGDDEGAAQALQTYAEVLARRSPAGR